MTDPDISSSDGDSTEGGAQPDGAPPRRRRRSRRRTDASRKEGTAERPAGSAKEAGADAVDTQPDASGSPKRAATTKKKAVTKKAVTKKAAKRKAATKKAVPKKKTAAKAVSKAKVAAKAKAKATPKKKAATKKAATKKAAKKKAAPKKKSAPKKKVAAKKKPAPKKKVVAKKKPSPSGGGAAAVKKKPATGGDDGAPPAHKTPVRRKRRRKTAASQAAVRGGPAAPAAVDAARGEERVGEEKGALPSARPKRRTRRVRRPVGDVDRRDERSSEGATREEVDTPAPGKGEGERSSSSRRRSRRRRGRGRGRGDEAGRRSAPREDPAEPDEGVALKRTPEEGQAVEASGEESARSRRRRRKSRRKRGGGGDAPADAPANAPTGAGAAKARAADERAEAAASDDRESVEVEEVRPPKEPPPEKVLLVNARDPEEVRIALLEDGVVEELYVEGAEERSATGNVYRGRVQNVEKSIGAAFVDLGKGLTGFLHVSDVPDRPDGATITEALEPGQEVLVQITRDSIGRKGPALTGRIALPGRYLVLLATSSRSGVSRRIGRGSVRDRARKHLEQLEIPEGMGLIVRTAGEDSTVDDLQRDLDHLLREWDRLKTLSAQSGPPTMLRTESDVAERSIRDIMPLDTSRIIVDHEPIAAQIRRLLGAWYGPIPRRDVPAETDGESSAPVQEPRPMPEVVAHEGPIPLFHAYDVESQLEQAFRRSVRLPSGGSIVIDPTEALVAIDVNSGRFTAEEDPEATAVSTNLEAAKEAARQLRLRDLGGLIVLDFIDMRDRRKERKVEKELKQALARDRARIRVGRIGPFGCLILSRQRVRQALSRVTHAECPECGGTGRRRHPAGLGLRVLREMQARVARAQGRGGLEARVPRAVKDWVLKNRSSVLRAIEASCSGPIRVDADHRLAADGWAMKGLPPTASADTDAERPEEG